MSVKDEKVTVGGHGRRTHTPPLPLWRWAAVGVAVAIAGVVVLLLPSSRLLTLVGALLVLTGALACATVGIGAIHRHQLRRQAEFVSGTVERGVLDALLPGRVMEHLLDRVYGPSPSNRDVATAVLGGEGLAPDGDLTISDRTEIDFELSRIDDETYRLVMEERYRFRNRVPTSRFVFFATSDYELRDRIVSGCRMPLFELWFVGAEHAEKHFEESVESMRDSVHIGMHYVDADDRLQKVSGRDLNEHLEEVKLRDWGRYLSFFRTDLPEAQRLDRGLYMDRLRIFELDLRQLAPEGTSIETIERLTVRSTTLQRLAAGYCYWEAAYPCYVGRMGFDTTQMTSRAGAPLMFHLKPFTFGSLASPVPWSTDDVVVDVTVEGWVLPGQGVELMWREL